MPEWIKDNKDNLYGLLKILLPLFFIILIINSIPRVSNFLIEKRYDAKTIGIVDSLIIQNGIVNRLSGSFLEPHNYTIHFHYEIDNKVFNKTQNLVATTLKTEAKIKLRQLNQSDTIIILYKLNNPFYSKIKSSIH